MEKPCDRNPVATDAEARRLADVLQGERGCSNDREGSWTKRPDGREDYVERGIEGWEANGRMRTVRWCRIAQACRPRRGTRGRGNFCKSNLERVIPVEDGMFLEALLSLLPTGMVSVSPVKKE